METINDRMEMLINERFNGNKAAFAKAIGTERATLSNYVGSIRRSKPSVNMVTKIVVALNVDARWLLTGEESNSIKKTNAEDVSPAKEAIYEERIKALEAVLAEKERIIRLYEKFVEKDENKILK